MSIDKIINNVLQFLSPDNDTPFTNKKFSAKKYIRRKFYLRKSKSCYIIFFPWHGPFITFNILKNKILKRGYSCLVYSFPPEILSANYALTNKYFEEIKMKVKKDLNNIKRKHKFLDYFIIGNSLMCVNTMMIANNNPDIKKIILISPGNCLAESLWYGIRTKYLRKSFEKSKMNLKKLKEYWKDLAPENNLSNLNGKDVSVFLSEADELIPYRFGKLLADKMTKLDIKIRVYTNKYLGHYLTIIFYCLFPKNL